MIESGARDIIDRFREWLEAARTEAGGEQGFEMEAGSQTDLPRKFGIIDLVEEFTALRHEIKLETKSNRGLADQTGTVLQALEGAIEQFRSVEPKEARAAWAAGKGLAEGLADLDEALQHGERDR